MTQFENGLLYTIRKTGLPLIKFIRWIIAALFILYLLSGSYSISSNEIGILQRFGKVIDDKVQPGIHYAFPWPIDCVTKVPIRVVKRIVIDDFYSTNASGGNAIIFANMTNLDSYCVTGDNNLVNVTCVIQYTIINPFNYLFRARDPEIMLRSMASNTIIHCLAGMPIDETMTRGKQAIANYIKTELQKRLDDSHSGLSVSFVELKDIKPPDRVEQYFSDVVKANIDREKMINNAESYKNEKIPAAKAEATRLLQEAEGYKKEIVLRAEGDAQRFEKLLVHRVKKGDSTRKMIYIETMKEVLEKVEKKYIVVPKSDGDPPARLKIFNSP
ncbi:MAG: FtsH protease activity modulator HflK [Desulfobacteraceae bacterium]|nr:FtsH protease activity modulator HflK [Desulfobacteraceae bacterium]MBC2755422.1 FtsH protease activity modulator HflK [Desulfobacteraceae bacterium]